MAKREVYKCDYRGCTAESTAGHTPGWLECKFKEVAYYDWACCTICHLCPEHAKLLDY